MSLQTASSAEALLECSLAMPGIAEPPGSMPTIEAELSSVKQRLLLMGSHAEAAVNRALRALLRRDDDLARQTKEDDNVIDTLELEIDHAVLALLSSRRAAFDLRLLVAVMKAARELERVGDEATTISRRCLELSNEPPLKFQTSIPQLARMSLEMLKAALDAFVSGNAVEARAVVSRDDQVDQLHRDIQRQLADRMREEPNAISRCLQLIVITKSLERIADHATNVAEIVVYLYEGRDIRHMAARQ